MNAHFSARALAFVLAAGVAGCSGGAVPAGGAAPVAGATAGRRAAAAGSARWVPAAGSTFAVQYQGRLDTRVKADAFDVDGFDTTAATVKQLHASQHHAVCYIDAGTWEKWRPDAGRFPQSVLGKPDGHWPGERWLDIRQLSVLQPLMAARFKMCQTKNFDAVDPDNIDGYENHTGFPLTSAEQLAYDTWVAQAVHALGMSVAQKNDGDQLKAFGNTFDFAVTEQCAAQHFCGTFAPYTAKHHLVIDIEYGMPPSKFIRTACPETAKYDETAILKHLSLNAWVVTCPS